MTRHQSCDPVPLQAVALAALERPSSGAATALLFPALNGGYLDLHNFRNRNWKSAQLAAEIGPFRRIYDHRQAGAHVAGSSKVEMLARSAKVAKVCRRSNTL